MDSNQLAALTEHYDRMDDWTLADMSHRPESLTEEARAALAAVVAKRGIDLRDVAAAQTESEYKDAVAAGEKAARKERRYAKFAAIYCAIAIPIALIGAVLRPEKALATLVSSAVLVIVLTAGSALWKRK